MRKILPFLMMAFLAGFSATALAENASGPSGFSDVSGSAGSEGKTGENAECPIKKTINGKTFCFQNDPALTKPQGGH
jgi:hypothetical protein